MAEKSIEVSKHVNVEEGSNYATPNAVNVGLEAFPTISKAHGIHSFVSTNEANMNDVGAINIVTKNGTMVGPNLAGNTHSMSTSYANVTGVPSRKALNFHTLFTLAETGLM
ncbi:hypothetical protein Tco_0306528 [Tanacetum coccineum]